MRNNITLHVKHLKSIDIYIYTYLTKIIQLKITEKFTSHKMIYFAGPLEIMIDLAKASPKICQCNDQLLNTKCNLT